MNGKNKVKETLKLVDTPDWHDIFYAIKRCYYRMDKGKYRLRDLCLVTILAFTGCRLGEALLLTKKDVDPKNKTIRIMQLKKKKMFVRIVPVPNEWFWKIINRYLRRFSSGDDKLFNISDRGARYQIYKFTKLFLGRRIRPHAIRHAYATKFIKQTKDLEAARRLLGHSSYRHLKCYLDYTQEDLKTQLEQVFK